MDEYELNLIEMTPILRNPKPIRIYTVEKQRYIVLLTFVFLGVVNTYQALNFSPVPDIVAKVYNLKLGTVNVLSMMYDTFYAPFVLPWLLFNHRYGLRKTFLLSAGLNLLGAAFKLFAVTPSLWYLLLAGQIINAISNNALLTSVSLLATRWFPAHERGAATSIAVLSVNFGIAIALLVQPYIVPEPNDQLYGTAVFDRSFTSQAAASALALLLVIFFMPERPRFPPSASASKVDLEVMEEEPSQPMRQIIRLFSVKGFPALHFFYGLTVAIGWAVPAVFTEVMCVFGYTDLQIGSMGFAFTISGMLTVPLTSYLIDMWRVRAVKDAGRSFDYRWPVVTLCVLCSAAFLSFTYLLSSGLHSYFNLLAVYAVAGAVFSTVIPVGLEFATELTYPTHEDISAGALFSWATSCSVLMAALMTAIIGGGSLTADFHYCQHAAPIQQTRSLQVLLFVSAVSLASAIGLCFVKGEYKRMERERSERRMNTF